MNAAPEKVVPLNEEVIEGIRVEDFRAYLPGHSYIYEPTGEMWPAASVNAKLTGSGKKKANEWLDENRAVVQITWSPAEPRVIDGKIIHDGGWVAQPGVSVFNQYRPPAEVNGDPDDVNPWLEHIANIYPHDCDHIIGWLAHRCQYPGEKINHALLLGGSPGIGKDTMLDPIRVAVGPWNFQEITPQQLLGRFNGFIKAVVLRISETRDLGDMDRYDFYEHSKQYLAAPPEVIRCDEKHIREHCVPNVMGVILTTNNKTNGIYLPSDDRRHYVAWSQAKVESMPAQYFERIYAWYARGGRENVIAYLRTYDLSNFDAKAPPPKTQAFYEIVDANRSPEDAEMSDTLERMKYPDALTIPQLTTAAEDEFSKWLQDRKNRRSIPHRLETAGYQPVRNATADQGLWKVDGKRQTVYAKSALTYKDQCIAAGKLQLSNDDPRRWT